MDQNELPEEYRPISPWGFVGLFLLSSIPCVGIICIIVFACGGVRNKNIVNFARGQLILLGIILAIYLVLILLGVAGGIFANMIESIR